MTTTTLTAAQAEAQGFTVDRHCYPWFAYKGPRFSPEETVEVITEAHVPGDGASTELRARCVELIDIWGEGVSPEASGFAEELQEALDTTTPVASEDTGGIPLIETPLTVDEATALSNTQGDEGGYITVLVGVDETALFSGLDHFLDRLDDATVTGAILEDISYEPHPATGPSSGLVFKVTGRVEAL